MTASTTQAESPATPRTPSLPAGAARSAMLDARVTPALEQLRGLGPSQGTGPTPAHRAAAHPMLAARTAPVRRLLPLLAAWYRRWQQRRALMDLSDHSLRDMGISPADAYREGSKPFWRP